MTETPEAPDRVLRRIEALLARAAHDGTPAPEREAAMATAMDMMAKYGVDQAMVAARDRGDNDPIEQMRIHYDGSYRYEKMMLLVYIYAAFGCKGMRTKNKALILSSTVIGYRSDLEQVRLLYSSLVMQAMQQVADVRPQWWEEGITTTAYRKNWLIGFGHRVGVRIKEARDRARADYDRSHGGGTELVFVGREARVADAYDEQFGELKQAKGRRRDGLGISEGVLAGDRADIGDKRLTEGGPLRVGR